MEACSTLTRRLKNNGFSLVVSRQPVSLLPVNCTKTSVLPIREFRCVLRSDFDTLPGQLSFIAWRYIRTPAIFVAAAARRFTSSNARTNQSPKPHSGSIYNWLLLNNYSLLEYSHPAMPFNYVSR
jgi:hypothetical protein